MDPRTAGPNNSYKYHLTALLWSDIGEIDIGSYLIDHCLFNQMGFDRGQKLDQPVKPILKK